MPNAQVSRLSFPTLLCSGCFGPKQDKSAHLCQTCWQMLSATATPYFEAIREAEIKSFEKWQRESGDQTA